MSFRSDGSEIIMDSTDITGKINSAQEINEENSQDSSSEYSRWSEEYSSTSDDEDDIAALLEKKLLLAPVSSGKETEELRKVGLEKVAKLLCERKRIIVMTGAVSFHPIRFLTE